MAVEVNSDFKVSGSLPGVNWRLRDLNPEWAAKALAGAAFAFKRAMNNS